LYERTTAKGKKRGIWDRLKEKGGEKGGKRGTPVREKEEKKGGREKGRDVTWCPQCRQEGWYGYPLCFQRGKRKKEGK